MVTKLTDRIVEILRSCPYGLTAKEVASRLDATASNISSRLSKLAAYGVIVKTRGRHRARRFAAAIYSCAVYNAPLVPIRESRSAAEPQMTRRSLRPRARHDASSRQGRTACLSIVCFAFASHSRA